MASATNPHEAANRRLLQMTDAEIQEIRRKAFEQQYPQPVKFKKGYSAKNPPPVPKKRRRPPYIPGVSPGYTEDEILAAF